jgi:hypothetical protein
MLESQPSSCDTMPVIDARPWHRPFPSSQVSAGRARIEVHAGPARLEHRPAAPPTLVAHAIRVVQGPRSFS